MSHLPVLLKECIEGLQIRADGIYVDGTYGRGGHCLEIAKRLTTGKVIAIDQDEDAFAGADGLLLEYRKNVELVHGNFCDISNLLLESGYREVDGMLFDLGVSSPQLDSAHRGFSYMQDAVLDMRMDRSSNLTAKEIVNNWTESALKKIFYEYGEERYAALIARAIIKKRQEKTIETTFDLNAIIFSAIPAAARREAQHPSKRCFQALRIAVNDELGAIEKMLKLAPERLKKGGRICIISFHSLEDRLVKNAFIAGANGCSCPRDFPVCACGFIPTLKIVTKKPITSGAEELMDNPRARSAKLRIAQKI